MPKKTEKREELFDVKQYGSFFVPRDVVGFLVGLTQLSQGEKVLAVGFLNEDLDAAVGKGVELKAVRAEAFNSEQSEQFSQDTFEVILCAPTFGVPSAETNEPNEDLWLKWGVDHLRKGGRLAIVVPIGLLSNVSQEPIRRFLLERGGLEAVIEIPSGWAHGTAIQASILYVTTNRNPDRSIRMFRFPERVDVNWSLLEREVRRSNPELPVSSTGKAYAISASQLNSARLDAKYYDPRYAITSPDPSFEEVKLGEIVEIRSGDRFDEADLQVQGVPFVQVRNITQDGELDLRDARTLKLSSAVNSRSYSAPGDVLISIAGTIGKVAIVPLGMHVCVDTSLRRLRILDQDRVLPEYLAHYLRSDISKLQMERWFSGSVIRVLSTPNLEQIVVYLPDIDTQREIVRTFNEMVRQRIELLQVSVQVVKTRITPPHATADRLREARTEPGRHARQLRMPL